MGKLIEDSLAIKNRCSFQKKVGPTTLNIQKKTFLQPNSVKTTIMNRLCRTRTHLPLSGSCHKCGIKYGLIGVGKVLCYNNHKPTKKNRISFLASQQPTQFPTLCTTKQYMLRAICNVFCKQLV